jgi:acetylornithine/N-succinyldiaminopimelate aminotransferase
MRSMDTQTQTLERYNSYLIRNYAMPSLVLVRGEGTRVWDATGKSYLDFTSGIGVTALGHSHPHWVSRVAHQLSTVAHVSNLFANPWQAELAERLVGYCGAGKVLFCNSGAEANEALLKLARLHGTSLCGEEGRRCGVITALNGFHGRTFGGMSATPQEKIQKGFRPLLPDFAYATLNDIASFDKLITEQTAGVLLETIQGEGGVFPCDPVFLRELRALCDERQVLLMLDEVQCGLGRTGNFFAFEEAGVVPDAIGMAKGLGGAFPIGAIWVREPYAGLFQPGSHGTTFGGNPLACAAALAVLDCFEQDQLLLKVKQQSQPWRADLEALAQEHATLIKEVRGSGFMVGLGLHGDPAPIITKLREAGLLTVMAGNQTIRLLPPLTVTDEDLRASLEILRQVFASIRSNS